jgi:riboflavin synthase
VFTGIVRERAPVESFENGRLVVQTELAPSIGESISVDGVCLTVVKAENGRIAFDVVPESLARAKPFGPQVNLEPALRAGDPLGGHYVQGHVDAKGRVRSVGDPVWIDASPEILRYCVEKGSVAVDGVALTITGLDETGFAVALVPHTLEVTTLADLEPGTEVNLEVDVLAKYVERLLVTMGRR